MELVDTIREMVLPVLERMGIELVDLELHGTGGRTVLRIFVHEEGGITLDRCTEASREISDILDRKDPIEGRYVLEVSSPGLTRPLQRPRDFERNMGQKVKITYFENQNRKRVVGVISSVAEGEVVLQTGSVEQHIPMDEIRMAKLVIDF